MRKLLSDITQRFQSFISQRDDLALVVISPAGNNLPLLKILEGLEEASTAELYWIVPDDFSDAVAYADAVVAAFSTKHEAVRLGLEKEGMKPWPPIPHPVLDKGHPPAQRLRALAAFSRELLPTTAGGAVVWVFFPGQIANPTAYAALWKEVLQHEFPFPWCHHLRFIIRTETADRTLRAVLANTPRIEWFEPDLSLEAINDAMEAEIADEAVPEAERLNLLLIMASMDCTNQRYPQAMEKYERLLRYHAPRGNYGLAALALNGCGEVYEKTGNLPQASKCYEAALIPASHGETPPVQIFLNVLLNLANLRQTQERWVEAEAYYDLTQKLATVTRDAPLKIRSLESRGICQHRQGKLVEADKTWNDGLVMAAQLQDVELCRSLLKRLRQHYARTSQTAKEREASEQLAALSQ